MYTPPIYPPLDQHRENLYREMYPRLQNPQLRSSNAIESPAWTRWQCIWTGQGHAIPSFVLHRLKARPILKFSARHIEVRVYAADGSDLQSTPDIWLDGRGFEHQEGDQ